MKLPDCYRILGLREGSSFEEIKASYRRLARQHHPDANPDNEAAQTRFVRIAEAYRILSQHVAPEQATDLKPLDGIIHNELTRTPASTVQTLATQQLKQDIYRKLQLVLQRQRFPRAIALVEGLAQRLPEDNEVRQWQAITYQHWARHLIAQGQTGERGALKPGQFDANPYDKARIYLKKALRLLPAHLPLAVSIEQELDRLEQLR